jgi:hypothetical protein
MIPVGVIVQIPHPHTKKKIEEKKLNSDKDEIKVNEYEIILYA